MKKEALIITLIFLLLIPLISANPIASITENVVFDYANNGTQENFTGSGHVDVELSNIEDVLQFLRLNLSETNKTNLVSNQAYRNVAAAITPGDKTRMYVKTTNGDQDLTYNITNSTLAQKIVLRLDYNNEVGGKGLISGQTNKILLVLNMSSPQGRDNVSVMIQFKKDSYLGNDMVNVTGAKANGFTTNIIDSDSDSWNDKIEASGSLVANVEKLFYFNITLTPDVNYNESDIEVDLDSGYGIEVKDVSDNTLTGIVFTELFSRGPIREGVTMTLLQTSDYSIRGFIKNIAKNLTYTINGWNLYKVSNLTDPVLSSSQTKIILPEDTAFTEWYTAPGTQKPYYTTAFNWHIDWGGTRYESDLVSRTKLPTFRGMEIFADKTITVDENTETSRQITITDRLRSLGSLDVGLTTAELNSLVPNQATDSTIYLWTIGTPTVSFKNASGTYDITTNTVFTIIQSNQSVNGTVNVKVNLTQAIGRQLKQNEDIILTYPLTATPTQTTYTFEFNLTASAVSTLGTAMTTTAYQSLTLPGYLIPPTPPPTCTSCGPTPTPTEPYDIVKETADITIIVPQDKLAQVVVVDKFIAGSKGIINAGGFIYVPDDAELDIDSVVIEVYSANTGQWTLLENEKDFEIIDMGYYNIGDRRYQSDLIRKLDGSWTFYNDDKIRITYDVKLQPGTNYVLTRVFGESPTQKLYEDAYTPIRIPLELVKPVQKDLEIKEGPWEQEEIVEVSRPVTWIKSVEVYNPNGETVKRTFRIEVFQDILNAYLILDNTKKELTLIRQGSRTFIEFTDSISAHEREIYFIEAITPPVLEVNKDTRVIEINESMVVFQINITIENSALEKYKNVVYLLPTDINKTLTIKFEGQYIKVTPRIVMGEMDIRETKNIIIIYKEKIPVFTNLIEKPEYACNNQFNYTIFLIPENTESGLYVETEIIGPKKENSILYADITSLGSLESGKQVRIPKNFDLSFVPEGKYKLVTRLRKDFLTLLSAENDVQIRCPRSTGPNWFLWLILLLMFLIFVVYFDECRRKRLLLELKQGRFNKYLRKVDKIIRQENYFLERNLANLVSAQKIDVAVKLFRKARYEYVEIIKLYTWLASKNSRKCCCSCLNEEESKVCVKVISKLHFHLTNTRIDLLNLIRAVQRKDVKHIEVYKQEIRQVQEEAQPVKEEVKQVEEEMQPIRKKIIFEKTKKKMGYIYFVDLKGNITTIKVRRGIGWEEKLAKEMEEDYHKLKHEYHHLNTQSSKDRKEQAKYERKTHVKKERGMMYVDREGNVIKVVKYGGKRLEQIRGAEIKQGYIYFKYQDK